MPTAPSPTNPPATSTGLAAATSRPPTPTASTPKWPPSPSPSHPSTTLRWPSHRPSPPPRIRTASAPWAPPASAVPPPTFSLVRQAANGIADVHADGTFTYTPTGNFHGTDSFTFKATDTDGLDSDETTVTIIVNTAPGAESVTAATPEATVATGTLIASDVDSPTVPSFSLVGPATNGTALVHADGTFTYTPAGNFHGTDSFTFKATDADGLDSNVATVTIIV